MSKITLSIEHAEVMETLLMQHSCDTPFCYEPAAFVSANTFIRIMACESHKRQDMAEAHYMPAIRAFDAEMTRARAEREAGR